MTTELRPGQLKKLYEFLLKRTSSHGILLENVLAELAEATELVYIPPSTAVTSKKQVHKLSATRYGKLHTAEGMQVAHVCLRHRDAYARAVEQEGLGGSIDEGEWWGFNALYLVEDLVRNLTGFVSDKGGRGRRHEECLEALKNAVDRVPEVSTENPKKPKRTRRK